MKYFSRFTADGRRKMKTGNTVVFAALVALTLLTATSCATTGINRGQINLISTQEEIQLGKNLAAEVDREERIVLNNPVATYVSKLGQKIAAQTGRQDIPFSFKVILNDDEINAFALPGGPIYVYTGLLRLAENEAELASVLGHEIGHITARHSTEQLTKAYGIQLLSQLVLGEEAGAGARLAGDVVGSLSMLKFSRDDEIESDRLGIHYMFRAGYNPNAMLSFQRKLGELEGNNPSKVLNLLSTHPLSQARIDAIEQEIATLPPGRELHYHTERYKKIMDRAQR
jgi:predicted Zn-dependent protease